MGTTVANPDHRTQSKNLNIFYTLVLFIATYLLGYETIKAFSS